MAWEVLLVKLFKMMRRRAHTKTMLFIRTAAICVTLMPHLRDWKLMRKILIYHGSVKGPFSLNTMD
jgi:hypothetical protein